MNIIQRGKTSFATVLELTPRFVDGKKKRQQKWITVKARNKTEAKPLLEEEMAKIKLGLATMNVKKTVAQLMDVWMERYIKPEKRQDTIIDYDMAIRLYIGPYIGGISYSQLEVTDIEDAYQDLTKKVSVYAAHKAHRTMRAAFNKLKQKKFIDRNIIDDVDAPSLPEKEQPTFTVEQAMRFLQEAEKVPNFPVYLMALHTGMRRGEILGLRLCDVNFDTNRIRVAKTIKRNGVLEEPKSEKSRRIISMTDKLVSALKRYVEEREGLYTKDDDVIFREPEGTFINWDRLHREYKKLLTSANLPDIKFHCLRHTVATLLMEEGVSPKIVQELLGHSTIAMTMHYTHANATLQQLAISKLEDKIK